MSTITTRSGKGSPLTNNEVDANFTNLNTDKLESADLAGYAELTGATFTGEVEATGFNGDLTGAILFKGQAGEALTKGDPVYISGISGNKTVVSKADANDASKMPCFGIVDATVSANADCSVVTFGTLQGLDTSSFSEGDELFISDTGTLTTTAPTGESSQIQKIAKVTRSHASTGSIKVMGAGRTNAVPNLNDGQFFLGNGSNQAVSTDFTTSVLGEISAGTGIGISGSGVISNSAPDQTVSLTGAGTTTVSGTYPNFTITSTGGSGGNETLAQTLALGNTTGGTDIAVSSGDSITLPDASKIKLGDEPNLEIYHSGSHSFIEDVGGGSLFIKGGPQLKLMNDGENAVLCQKDGAVTLYHDNSAKVATTSSGISVTGNIALSGTADGRNLATDGTKLDGMEAGATADQTAAEILTAIKTVDGSGSGLDADLLQGVGLSATANFFGVVPHVAADGVMEVGKYIDFHLTDGDTSDNSTRLTSVDSNTLNINSSKIWHAGNDGSGSGLDADTVDGVQAIQLYRRTGSSAATAGPGWVTVASNTSGRKHGEVIVSDSDSGDHSFIRIDWMRSYADSAFTVLNSGGHANRITAVRVLEESSDPTYGTKYLQVLTTTSSTYSVRINTVADVGGYSSHTAVTPVTQSAISGYVTHSNVDKLDENNLGVSQGIVTGNGVFQGGETDVTLKYFYNGSDLPAFTGNISGAHTTAASGRIRYGSTTASFIQNGPGVTSNLSICANGGSTFFYGSTGAATYHARIAEVSQFDCGYGSVQNAYMVRAWGRFEMSGTHSFRDDEGFSSITDVATGRARLVFTNAMPNSYYSVQLTAGTTSYTSQVAAANIYSASTSQFYISVEDVDGSFIDKDQMNVTVVR